MNTYYHDMYGSACDALVWPKLKLPPWTKPLDSIFLELKLQIIHIAGISIREPTVHDNPYKGLHQQVVVYEGIKHEEEGQLRYLKIGLIPPQVLSSHQASTISFF